MREAIAGLVVALPFALGLASAPAEDGRVAFRFEDPEIVESSGLVVQDGLFLTTNDSGDSGRVFAVDPGTGETVGVTRWADGPEDVEALAPAGPGEVWVGDIGGNLSARSSVSVSRVPVGRGDRSVDAEAFDLAYPGAAADAETLLAHPVTGRLYVATKDVFGGRLYAAPARLAPEGPNPLRQLGWVLPVATDGAFFPDGRHLVLRDYSRAVVYTFPGLESVAELSIPDQQQGEGIAVSADGGVYVSSEGSRAPVLELRLPDDVRALVEPGRPPGSREGEELPEGTADRREPWPWVMGGLLGVVALAVVVRATRPR